MHPWQPILAAELALDLDGGVEGARDQRVGIAAHPERRHQVFKNGARPGKEHGAVEGDGVIAGQLEPALLGDVSFGDRQEGRDAGLGGEHVVGRGVQLPPCDLVPDGEEQAAFVQQEAKIHLIGKPEGVSGNRFERGVQRPQARDRVGQQRAQPFAEYRTLWIAGSGPHPAEACLKLNGKLRRAG